uniref:Putative secreted protein 94 n=1 Tax=Amblyomma triste TaxID=251400 RepID=A0A023G6T9_AMBTT
MLLLPLLIVGFGVCPIESENVPGTKPLKNRTLIRGTKKFLRSHKKIHLLMYSASIKDEIPTCISSKLLIENKEDDGFWRTLEADGNITADFGKPVKPIKTSTTKPPKMMKIFIRKNVTVYVGEVYPTLHVLPDEGTLPTFWDAGQTILHAAGQKCMILAAGSYNGDVNNPPCTLWGYHKEKKCEQKFKNLCGDGVSVDLSICDYLENEGDHQEQNQHKPSVSLC